MGRVLKLEVTILFTPLPKPVMTHEEGFVQIESILLQNTSQMATLLEAQIKSSQQIDGNTQAIAAFSSADAN